MTKKGQGITIFPKKAKKLISTSKGSWWIGAAREQFTQQAEAMNQPEATGCDGVTFSAAKKHGML